ncbi:MAG: hypothetical protein GXX92_11660 [Clostridiales bacterium]|nr:hypothetical protein [Clostridiales bacterium]
MPVLSVIEGGILAGYVPVDKNWSGFSTEDYRTACESVERTQAEAPKTGKQLYMGNYRVVRAEYFPSLERPSMTIENGKLRFNTACLKKFEDVEYVELLLNTVTNTIAIRPCDADNPNAIHWGRLREERWIVNSMGCRGLSRTLFDLMNWEDEGKYKFSGQFLCQGGQKLMIFELDEAVVTKTVEQVIVPEEAIVPEQAEAEAEEAEKPTEEIVVTEKVRVYPASWHNCIGERVSVLEQHHYAGDWDVLRPATELGEMNVFTTDQLDQLKKEAETIMEGWKKTA